MGILGALSTAVSGLAAQSYALENISGNIANASTTGFKRVDTSFENLVANQPVTQQLSGSVSAGSSLTTTIQGTLSSTGVATNVAISGDGFFVVSQNTGTTQNPTFGSGNLYTRRGDFTKDSNGYLTNGAGYFLSGTTYDPSTGAAVGVSPSPIQISSAALAAKQTATVSYSGNLPSLPQPTNYDGTAGTELLPLDTTGTSGTAYTPPAADTAVSFTINGETKTTTIPANATLASAVALMNSAAGSTTMFAVSGTKIAVTTSDQTVKLSTATQTALGFGTSDLTYATPTTYSGAESSSFVSSSISGGQVSVYSSTGTAANLQLRWAKTDSTTTGGTDTWQLYYQNSSDTSATTAWTAVGDPVAFDTAGATSTSTLALSNVTVGGVSIGSLSLDLSGGLSQYGDSTGAASVSLDQDGYTSGALGDITINDDGSIVGSYSNGQSKTLGEIAIAKFSASDALKAENGGAYSATVESGNPVLTMNGSSLTGGSLEASNTDISSEFSKMIVTQQAYSANTKVMSTAQTMLEDIINIIR